jgi:hypothetical protein
MALFSELWNAGLYRRATFRGRKHTNLLQWDRLNLPINGSAPKFYKRTILAGLASFFLGFHFFSLPEWSPRLDD